MIRGSGNKSVAVSDMWTCASSFSSDDSPLPPLPPGPQRRYIFLFSPKTLKTGLNGARPLLDKPPRERVGLVARGFLLQVLESEFADISL